MARATALKEGLRVARDAMREDASAQPFTAPPQSLQRQPELEAKEEEQVAASWAAVHNFEALLEFAAEAQEVSSPERRKKANVHL